MGPHFVSLHDAHTGRRRLLSGLRQVDPVTFETLDGVLSEGWRHGWHAFAWLPYDLGEAHFGLRADAPGAIYWFADRTDGDAPPRPAGEGWLIDPRPDISEEEFTQRIATVRQAIAAGDVYQVNYTHRVRARAVGDPVALFHRLFERQPVAYGVLAHLPAPAAPWTMSLSPELFLKVDDGVVTAQPMKGTAPGHSAPESLSGDVKNRAENLMIVDLLRNDLSHVSVPGTVSVPALFETERVGTLWQMTSTVRASLAPETTPGRLLAATFPCGSITGAPKLAAMGLIRRLECDPRGSYTGALGVIEPEDSELGWRAVLSIAIRTLELDPDAAGRNAVFGVGSGVVIDSDAATEWAECRAKAGFLEGLGPTVGLIETMRVVDGRAPLAQRHRERLVSSAEALGFTVDAEAMDRAVRDTPAGAWRVRLLWSPDGGSEVTLAPLDAMPTPVRLVLAPEPWRPSALAGHKTTDRAYLNDAIAHAEGHGAFDSIGYDAGGNVLEGGRTSIFARIGGRWVTPPLHLGILPGVQRAEVLAHPGLLGTDRIDEVAFTTGDLLGADALAVTNAVHGILDATMGQGDA